MKSKLHKHNEIGLNQSTEMQYGIYDMYSLK